MSLSKDDFRGTGKIFSFTFRQMMKNKGNIVSIIIMVLMAIVSVPAIVLLGGNAAESSEVQTSAIYVADETGLSIDWSELSVYEPYFADVPVYEAEFEPDEYAEYLVAGEVMLHAYQDGMPGNYHMTVGRISEESPDDAEAMMLFWAAESVLDAAKYETLDVSSEQLAVLNAGYYVSVQRLDEYLNPPERMDEDEVFEEAVGFDARYWLQLMYSIVVLMLSVMSISYIVRAVVEEKASKLVELLMVSVRPLALIVGKILAAMAFVFGMFAMMIVGFGVSYAVTGLFLDMSVIGGSLEGLGISAEMFSRVDALAVISIIVSLLTGYLTFSIVAGLFASGCSSTSEMEGATMPPTMIILAGYMVSCIISAFDGGPAITALSLCPVVSVFCAPVQYLIGNIGFGVLTLAWIIQLIVVVLLALFCAKIYNELIIYKGERIGVRRMIAMAKGSRKGGRAK